MTDLEVALLISRISEPDRYMLADYARALEGADSRALEDLRAFQRHLVRRYLPQSDLARERVRAYERESEAHERIHEAMRYARERIREAKRRV